MEIEIYSISLFGLNPHYYTNSTIGSVWDVAAAKVFEETGINVTGEVHDRIYVDQEDKELNGTTIFMIQSDRIPNEISTKEKYWSAYKAVVEEVRKKLDNPRMNLSIMNIVLTFFEKF